MGFTMKKLSKQVLAGVFALSLLSTAANAGVKVRADELAQVETVAVVGYSFWRDVEMEGGSPFKMKNEVIELTDTDAEYLMMQEADERVLEALQALGTFIVLPREEVLAKELVSGSAKSDMSEKSSTRGWGDQDNGVSVEVEAGRANPDEFYAGLLSGFMADLNKDLSQK